MEGLRLVGLAMCAAAFLGCLNPAPGPGASASSGLAPATLAANPEVGRSLNAEQLDAIVKPTLETCSPQASTLKSGRIDPASIIPVANAKEFPADRVPKTLHGIWRGGVVGDDGDVGVDYFWFMDTKNNEALIIAQRTGKQTLARMRPVANAPKFSYLICAHQGYFPSKETPQMQEFIKVSDDLKEAPRLLEEATGLPAREGATMQEMWDGLLKMDYFNKIRSRAKAFGGALFKSVQIGNVPNPIGPSHISMSWQGTYFGGGSTAVKWTPDVPIKGVEYGQFVGTASASGDFLVSSPGNGRMWKVEAMAGGNYDLAFDAVSLGPMQ